MSEEWPEPGQECINHYYYISMQAFNLLVLSRKKEMQKKMLLAWLWCAERPGT